MKTTALLIATSTLTAISANAGLNIVIQEQGANVIASASGSLNIDNLNPYASEPQQPAQIKPVQASIDLGVSSGQTDVYTGDSGPVSFGDGTDQVFADSFSGDYFGVSTVEGVPYIALPDNYTTGTDITSAATWLNSTLDSLGITPGTYIFGWSGDSVTVNVVPEPGTWGALAGAGVLMATVFYRRRRKA